MRGDATERLVPRTRLGAYDESDLITGSFEE